MYIHHDLQMEAAFSGSLRYTSNQFDRAHITSQQILKTFLALSLKVSIYFNKQSENRRIRLTS